MKKLSLILKSILIIIYLFISYLIWKNKDHIFKLLILVKSNQQQRFLHTFYSIALFSLLAITLVILIYLLFSKRKSIRVGNDNISLNCYKKERDKKDSNVMKYYISTHGKSLHDFLKMKDKIELSMNIKIYNITYDINSTKSVIVYGTPYNKLQPRKYSLSYSDMFLKKIKNLLCIGATGSGKTYFLKILIANLLLYFEEAKLYLCDFKNYDFRELDKCKRYFGYTNTINGINEVYEEFQQRIASNEYQKDFQPIILFIDEYATLLSNIGKEAESIQKKVAEILFMGRSYNIIPIVALQRADSIHFKNGARDQFGTIVALGNLSEQQKDMLFHDYKDSMTDVNGIGEGYVYEDGEELLQRIKVEQVSDIEMELMMKVIKQALEK